MQVVLHENDNGTCPVKFKTKFHEYQAGEIAGFAKDFAEKLVAANVAEAVRPETKPKQQTQKTNKPQGS